MHALERRHRNPQPAARHVWESQCRVAQSLFQIDLRANAAHVHARVIASVMNGTNELIATSIRTHVQMQTNIHARACTCIPFLQMCTHECRTCHDWSKQKKHCVCIYIDSMDGSHGCTVLGARHGDGDAIREKQPFALRFHHDKTAIVTRGYVLWRGNKETQLFDCESVPN